MRGEFFGELQLENGKLIGNDKGEWGGSISFKPKFGPSYIILNENFRGFYQNDNRIFVLTGLSHLQTDNGAIYELKQFDGIWNAELKINLNSNPYAFILDDKDIYVVTRCSLIMIRDGWEVITLVEDAFWSYLVPNSIILKENSIFIGMRGGVFEYNLLTTESKWYVVSSSVS